MTRRPTTVRPHDDLALARQVMLWRGVRHLPVLHHGRLVGMLSDRDLLAAIAARDRWSAGSVHVEEAMRSDVPTIDPDRPVEEAARRMLAHRVEGLPVLEDGDLVGIVTTSDLLLDRSEPSAVIAPRRGTARDVMTPDPDAVAPENSLLEAASRMVEGTIRHLPVVDSDGRLVGMLSDRDVRSAIGDPILALRERTDEEDGITVAEVMSEEPVRVTLDATIETLVDVLSDERIGAIAVVDEGDRPVGIVSYLDLLAYLTRRPGATP